MYIKSFTVKLIQASNETKNYYQELKNQRHHSLDKKF